MSPAANVSPQRETVIVVHGTWSGPSPGASPGWYAPGQAFCDQLDRALASRGSEARCWRHLAPGDSYFSWDSANDWLSRARAAERLRHLVRELHRNKWVVHLVGHSHGGNVIIDAITDGDDRVEPWFAGRVALLGTPIYQESSDFERRRKTLRWRWRIVSAVAWALLLYLAAQQVDLAAAFAIGSPTEGWGIVVGLIGALAGVFLIVRAAMSAASVNRLWLPPSLVLYFFANWSPGADRRSPPFMLLNSRFDEAWRSLCDLRSSSNPLLDQRAQRVRFGSAVRGIVALGLSRSSAVLADALKGSRPATAFALGTAAILVLLQWQSVPARLGVEPLSTSGASLVFWCIVSSGLLAAIIQPPVLLFPGIFLAEGGAVLWNGLRGITLLLFDRQIRGGVWSFLKAASLGLNGAPQRVQDVRVSRHRDDVSPSDAIYLELPTDIVARVTDAQRQQLHTVHELLYEETKSWSPTALREQLEAIEFPLVHTAYYRESQCIEKLAEWIVEPNKDHFDGEKRVKTTVSRAFGHDRYVEQKEEEITLPNAYRQHLDQLRDKFCPPGSAWYPGPTPAAPVAAASSTSPLQQMGPPPVN